MFEQDDHTVPCWLNQSPFLNQSKLLCSATKHLPFPFFFLCFHQRTFYTPPTSNSCLFKLFLVSTFLINHYFQFFTRKDWCGVVWNSKSRCNNMTNQHPILHCTFLLFLLYLLLNAAPTSCKFTIEPCSDDNSCNALLGYTLYTDLKVSEVASLFQIDPIGLLTANAIDISYSDVEHRILPSKLFLKVPITCSCADGIRKSVSAHYRTRPSDTLSSIADSVYGGLVSPDQLREANSIADPSVLDVGQNLVVPLPCTCFNGSDNSLPSIYLSYVVKPIDTLAAIAARYFTTLTDLMNVNDMGSAAISDGDILAVPIPGNSNCLSTKRKGFHFVVQVKRTYMIFFFFVLVLFLFFV